MLNNNQGGIDLSGTRSFAQFGGAGGVQQNANAGFQMGGAPAHPPRHTWHVIFAGCYWGTKATPSDSLLCAALSYLKIPSRIAAVRLRAAFQKVTTSGPLPCKHRRVGLCWRQAGCRVLGTPRCRTTSVCRAGFRTGARSRTTALAALFPTLLRLLVVFSVLSEARLNEGWQGVMPRQIDELGHARMLVDTCLQGRPGRLPDIDSAAAARRNRQVRRLGQSVAGEHTAARTPGEHRRASVMRRSLAYKSISPLQTGQMHP